MANVDLRATAIASAHEYHRLECVLHPALALRFEKRWRSFQRKYGEHSPEAQPKIAFHGTSAKAFEQMITKGTYIYMHNSISLNSINQIDSIMFHYM
jgi:hypothetical protein